MTDVTWLPDARALASRTTMATRLETILGRRILENSGDPVL